MTGAGFGFAFAAVLAWVGVGTALSVSFRRSASSTVFRLAALFLAAWAIFATTTVVWVLSNGGGPAVEQLLADPLTLFAAPHVTVWLVGAAGAFLVFLTAFLLNQTVGRGFLLLLRPREIPWPTRVPRPGSPVRLLAFASERAEAFTFTLVERGAGRRWGRCDVILVSDALLDRLTPAEWEAVLAHELGHIRELDGRYLTFFRTLSRLMRWDPVFAFLADALTRREEYRADLDAVEITGRPRALARALYKAQLLAPDRPAALPGLLGVNGRRGRRETVERIRRLVALAESGRFPEDTGA